MCIAMLCLIAVPLNAQAEPIEDYSGDGWYGTLNDDGTTYTLYIENQTGMEDWVENGEIGNYGQDSPTITTVNIDASVSAIPNGAFAHYYRCLYIKLINFGTNQDGTSDLRTIGANAFNYVNNAYFSPLPEGVETIGEAAFAYTHFGYNDPDPIPSTVTVLDGPTFSDCSDLTSVTVPEGVEDMSGVFHRCTNLESVVLPTSLTSLNGTFNGCTSLKSVDLSGMKNLTSIVFSAFRNCTSLTSITIPSQVEYINRDVFYGCTSLSSNTFMRDTPPSEQLEASAFTNISASGTVHIPTCAGIDAFEDELLPLLPEGWTISANSHVTDQEVATDSFLASPATCNDAARYYYSCACGEVTSTETFASGDPLGHDWGEWVETKAPTCTETGAEERTCKRGDAQEARTIDALGHDLENVEAVAPTCTEAGSAEHWVCSRCGALFADAAGMAPTTTDELVVEPTGHSFEDGACTVYGAKDPDYVAPEKEPAETPGSQAERPEIPATGDAVSIAPALAGAGAALSGAVAAWRRRSSRRAA